MAELTGNQLDKYKNVIAGALEKAEELSDATGVQCSAEAFRVRNVTRYVKPDSVAIQALYKLHQGLGKTIRLLVQTGQELDNIESIDGLDDLTDLKDILGGEGEQPP
jgi:hypothetical protein